jgi:hypothetical protein
MNMREKIARALCKQRGIDPDRQGHDGWPPYWPHLLPEVDAMLDALMEPTGGMVKIGEGHRDGTGHVDGLEPHGTAAVFTVMIRAAKEGK